MNGCEGIVIKGDFFFLMTVPCMEREKNRQTRFFFKNIHLNMNKNGTFESPGKLRDFSCVLSSRQGGRKGEDSKPRNNVETRDSA